MTVGYYLENFELVILKIPFFIPSVFSSTHYGSFKSGQSKIITLDQYEQYKEPDRNINMDGTDFPAASFLDS